jgi:hypothetical protein
VKLMLMIGPCVGGPHKGRRLGALETPHELALMGPPPPVPGEPYEEMWDEVRRGRYVFSAGVWWWAGWDARDRDDEPRPGSG